MVSSVAVAKPDDSPLALNPALKESATVAQPKDRPEVSLLLTVGESELPSFGEFPSSETWSGSEAASQSQSTQFLQQRFDNGKVNVERYVSEDAEGNLVNHGPYKEFDLSGTLVRSGNYSLGNLDGAWSQVISPEVVQSLSPKLDPGFRAPFKSEATFVDGKLHGDWTVTDSKGNPVFLWQFNMGTRENFSSWFDTRHTVILEIAYADGIPHGQSTEVVPGQREPKSVVFDRGRIVQTNTNWYEKGKKRSEEMYLAPAAKRIVSHDWWSSNVVSESLPSGEAIRHGSYTAWYANGQKGFEGNFVSGAPNGEFNWWYPNGQIQNKGSFDNGNCLGSWVWYHPNGMKMMEGTYENGVQMGQWSSWNQEGQLAMRADGSEFPTIKHELDLEPISVAANVPPTTKARHATMRVHPTKKR